MPLEASAALTAETPFVTTKLFDFLALSQELQDMIYDQCDMLEDNPLGNTTALPYPSHIVGTKPRVNLRLICRTWNFEYMKRCEGRKRLLVRTSHFTYSDSSPPLSIKRPSSRLSPAKTPSSQTQ